MKIVVKGADFSAVKIGTAVEIPETLQPAVTAMGLSGDNLNAVVKMYNSLNDGGYWGKIDKLYLPVVAPSLAVSHVNLKDGQVDFVPGENLALNDYGIVGVGEKTGVASIDYVTPVIGFTTFGISFDETENVYSQALSMIGLYKNGDDAYQQFSPIVRYNDPTILNVISRFGSANYGENVPKGGFLVVTGCTGAETSYAFVNGSFYTKSGQYNRSSSNKLCYYSNYGSNQDGLFNNVNLSKPWSITGICGTLTEEECRAVETIFKTFKSDIGK